MNLHLRSNGFLENSLDHLDSSGDLMLELFVVSSLLVFAGVTIAICIVGTIVIWKVRRPTTSIELSGAAIFSMLIFLILSVRDWYQEVDNLSIHFVANLIIAILAFGPACTLVQFCVWLNERSRN